MSETFYLFSKSSKTYVYLGRKGARDDFDYEGPLVWIDAIRSRLPASLLRNLLDRFRARHGDAVICSAEELFDGGELLGEDDAAVEIGGDRDADLPLSTYVPELDDADVRAAIRLDRALHRGP